jgi:hypothetical protein
MPEAERNSTVGVLIGAATLMTISGVATTDSAMLGVQTTDNTAFGGNSTERNWQMLS